MLKLQAIFLSSIAQYIKYFGSYDKLKNILFDNEIYLKWNFYCNELVVPFVLKKYKKVPYGTGNGFVSKYPKIDEVRDTKPRFEISQLPFWIKKLSFPSFLTSSNLYQLQMWR